MNVSRNGSSWRRSIVGCGVVCAFTALPAAGSAPEWPQWGGPNRDFSVNTTGLKTEWPAEGPKQLWSRNLGDGYSAILVDGDRLYTMYRENPTDENEFVVALNAKTGETVWEHKYPGPIDKAKMDMQFGPGPHSTPLLAGDKLFTIGVTGQMHAFDKATGKVVWSHDLVKEYDGEIMGRGYSWSPIAYKDTVIVAVGYNHPEEAASADGGATRPPLKADRFGEGHALMAFNQKDGSVKWTKNSFDASHASPILINFEGQEQLVVLSPDEAIGLKPDTGEMIWSHAHSTQFGANICTPVWGEGNMLFVTSGYRPGGSRGIKLARKDGKVVTEEHWYTDKMRVHFANAVRVGDRVYGSSGDFGPAFFTALDLTNKKVLWRAKDFRKANCLWADGKLIILDEDGNLGLAVPEEEGLKVLAKAQIMSNNAWTVPTLVGTKLYLRDRKTIKALELG